ncbi:MAG: hypothetical protein ACOYL6_19210 [Bacteriovoracaceae bacterium]
MKNLIIAVSLYFPLLAFASLDKYLVELIEKGEATEVRSYLELHPELKLNEVESNECSYYHFTVRRNDKDTISIRWDLFDLLKSKGADLNVSCGDKAVYYGPMLYVFESGQDILDLALSSIDFTLADVQRLIKNGAKLDKLNPHSHYNRWYTLLNKPIFTYNRYNYQVHPNTDAKADLLVNAKLNPNVRGNDDNFDHITGNCPGNFAVATLKMAQKLILAGSDFSLFCQPGYSIYFPGGPTALNWVASNTTTPEKENIEIAKLLLTKGASVNQFYVPQNSEDRHTTRTPFWDSVVSGQFEMAKFFLTLKPNLKLNRCKAPALKALPEIISFDYYSSSSDVVIQKSIDRVISSIKLFLDLGERGFESAGTSELDYFCGRDQGLLEQYLGKFLYQLPEKNRAPFASRLYSLLRNYGLQVNQNEFIYTLKKGMEYGLYPLVDQMVKDGANPNLIFNGSEDSTLLGLALSSKEGVELVRSWNPPVNIISETLTKVPYGIEQLKVLETFYLPLNWTNDRGMNQLYRMLNWRNGSYGYVLNTYYEPGIHYVLDRTTGPINTPILAPPPQKGYSTLLQDFYETVNQEIFKKNNAELITQFLSWLDILKDQGERMDWNYTDSDGRNVLYNVVRTTDSTKEVLYYFIKAGVNPKQLCQQPYQDGSVAKNWNLYFDTYNKDLVPELVSLGVNINQQDDKGETALMKRAAGCDSWYVGTRILWLNVVKALVENGADPKLKNLKGKSALDLASCDEVRKYLKSLP